MSTNVELKLTFKDAATAGLTKAATTAEKLQNKQLSTTLKHQTATANSYQKLHFQTVATFEKTARARETLGVRSEHVIRREIQQTRESYEQLKRSGMASANDISRAYEAQRRKVRELRNELGELTKTQKAMNAGKFGLSATAGIAAGAYVMKAPLMQALNFDERLAGMANTAFSERDVIGRKNGMRQLEAVINRSVQRGVGGGTREQAAEALDAMIAKNTLGFEKSLDFLPTVMRTAAGASAQPVDIANLSSVLYGQRIVTNDDQLKIALNMITASGQAGGFEIKDQAKWLAQQLPVAGKSGLTGLNGLQKVLTMNQAAILTSGTPDQAGNNVLNALTKINSSDTAKDFEKQGRGDLAAYLMNQRAKGVDSVTAWMNVIDKESASNPQMKAALAKLDKSKSKEEQKEIIESISAIAEGTVVGKYFQDMQATSALLGMRNKALVNKVDTAISKNRTVTGVNDMNYALMSGTASAQLRAADQDKDAGVKAAMDGLMPTVGKLSEQFSDLATKHPALAGSIVLAATGLTAVATASGVAAISMGGIGSMSGAIAAAAGGFATLANVVPLAASAFAGFQVGDKVINPLINKGVQSLTGNDNATLGTWIADVVNSDQLKQIDRNLGKVETTVHVKLDDGLKVVSQKTTSSLSPSIKNNLETGSVWGIPR